MRHPTVENLESRVLCSAAPAGAAGVALVPVGRAARAVVPTRQTWIIIHGLGGTRDDAGIRAMAAAVDGIAPQVIIADWHTLAQTNLTQKATNRNLQAAADALAVRVRRLGLNASAINLIGHSMGALVADRLAADLHARGGVNTIVALDPAAPRVGYDARGRVVRAAYHLAANSKYSIAFHAGDRLSPLAAALTADDTVQVQIPGGLDDVGRHKAVFDVFTNIARQNGARRPGAVSRLFSTTRIAAADLPDWKDDRYGGGYEAILYTRGSSGAGLTPVKLAYADRKGRGVSVTGG